MSTADDGVALANYRWEIPAAGDIGRRGVYIVHGLSEYAGRYEHVAAWLNARGWQVAAHDHRGHGRSGGRRASLRRADDLERDAAQRIAAFATELDEPPLLLGHSLGGLVAARIALSGATPLGGLILCSPAFKLNISAAFRRLIEMLAVATPGLPVPHRGPRPRLTHDQATAEAYARDPLVNRCVTPRLVRYIDRAGAEARAQAGRLAVRTLLLAAGEDYVVDASGSREFVAAAPPGKIALRWYENAWHELLQEAPAIARPVYADLDAWLAGV